MSDHNTGRYEGYTSSRLPVKLIWTCEFSDIRYAFEFERKIKKWTRAKKEALMRGDYDMLHILSKSTRMKTKNNLHD
jgi:predicted GIY-YIG superfamily endonuclease